jgi:hypothetical protein
MRHVLLSLAAPLLAAAQPLRGATVQRVTEAAGATIADDDSAICRSLSPLANVCLTPDGTVSVAFNQTHGDATLPPINATVQVPIPARTDMPFSPAVPGASAGVNSGTVASWDTFVTSSFTAERLAWPLDGYVKLLANLGRGQPPRFQPYPLRARHCLLAHDSVIMPDPQWTPPATPATLEHCGSADGSFVRMHGFSDTVDGWFKLCVEPINTAGVPSAAITLVSMASGMPIFFAAVSLKGAPITSVRVSTDPACPVFKNMGPGIDRRVLSASMDIDLVADPSTASGVVLVARNLMFSTLRGSWGTRVLQLAKWQ